MEWIERWAQMHKRAECTPSNNIKRSHSVHTEGTHRPMTILKGWPKRVYVRYKMRVATLRGQGFDAANLRGCPDSAAGLKFHHHMEALGRKWGRAGQYDKKGGPTDQGKGDAEQQLAGKISAVTSERSWNRARPTARLVGASRCWLARDVELSM